MYIVTGGAGFIGSAMIWELNRHGIDDILVVDNLSTSEKWKNLVNRRYTAYMHRDDFLKAIQEENINQPVTAIIHMGACSATTERNADYLMQNNLEYSKSLCTYALNHNARFINASSAATYGDGSKGFSDCHAELHQLRPLNMYGYSKQLFDLWAYKNGILDSITSLKFFNVFGPNEHHKGSMRSVVNKAFHEISATGLMLLFQSNSPDYEDGCQMRDFIYIKDCTKIMWWLLNNPQINGVFNVGSGKARTWRDLVTAVFGAMNLPANIQYMPMPQELAGKYQNFTQANMHKLLEAGYTTPLYSLEEGVHEYVRQYLATPDPFLE